MTEKYFGSSCEPSIFDKILSAPARQEDVSDDVRDLWQPVEQEPGVPPLLTMPGVLSVEDLNDPVKETVATVLGAEEARKVSRLTCNDVTQDERGLRQLIEEGCFRAAVNLTSRLLTIYGQGYGRLGQPAKHTPHSLQLWFTRFSLLAKLGLFELLQMESDAFGELCRPDIFYEFYPEMYSNRRGSMASFSFRLLLAELPTFLAIPNIALQRLTTLFNICRQVEKSLLPPSSSGAKFWRRRRLRVTHSIINCSLALKNFNVANDFMRSLLAEPDWSREELGALHSVAARIFMQCGDIAAAEKKVLSMRKLGLTGQAFQVQECVDRGLIYVAQNDFLEALKYFQKAALLEPSSATIANNIAVCLLYLGRMKDAIATYENMITSHPDQDLNEHFLINLCTLYELESNNSRPKKLIQLQKLAKQRRDICMNIDICLKLHSNN